MSSAILQHLRSKGWECFAMRMNSDIENLQISHMRLGRAAACSGRIGRRQPRLFAFTHHPGTSDLHGRLTSGRTMQLWQTG